MNVGGLKTLPSRRLTLLADHQRATRFNKVHSREPEAQPIMIKSGVPDVCKQADPNPKLLCSQDSR
jgi:hypothetical protein